MRNTKILFSTPLSLPNFYSTIYAGYLIYYPNGKKVILFQFLCITNFSPTSSLKSHISKIISHVWCFLHIHSIHGRGKSSHVSFQHRHQGSPLISYSLCFLNFLRIFQNPKLHLIPSGKPIEKVWAIAILLLLLRQC